MASLAELMVRVGADISEFTRQMQQVNNKMKDTGRGLMNVGKSVGDAGSRMAQAVTLPIMGLATSAVVIGAKFDKQMSKVQAISGATAGEFEKLRAKALELGASTSFSSSEVAMAMEELASAGFNTNQILGATQGVLDLAASAGIDLAEASSIAGNAINGFGLSANDASHVADVLAKASAISATNATGLGYAFKYVAPVAKTLGISLEETAGAIGLLANAGIDGSSAGTALRMGLLRLASPTNEMGKLMEATGSEFFDANGKMKNLAGIIDTLRQATKNMTDEQKTSYLATLFGAEAVSSFMVLMDAGSGKINAYTKELQNSNGEARKMADTLTKNLAGAWDNLTGALESLAISFSDVVKGDLQRLANKLTEVVNWLNKLSPGTKKAILVFGLLLASIAPLLIVIGFIAQGIGALTVAFGAISAPVLAVVAVIVAVGVALVALWKNSETFRNGLIAVFNAVKEKVTQALGVVVSFLQSKLAQIQKFWAENGSQILEAVQNAWNLILGVIKFVMPLILAVVKMVWESIKGVINGVLNFIMGLIKVFTGIFTGDFSKMWEGIKQMFFGAVEAIWNYFNLMFVGRIIKGIGLFIKGGWGLFKGFGSQIINFFKSTWNSMWREVDKFYISALRTFNTFKNMGLNVFNAFKATLSMIWQGVKANVLNAVTALKSGAVSGFNNLKSAGVSIFNTLKSVVLAVWKGLKSSVVSIVNGMKSTLSGVFNGIKTVAVNVFNLIKSALTGNVSGMKSALVGIWNGIKSSISGIANGLKSAVVGVFHSLKGTASSIFNSIKSAMTNPIQTAKSVILGIIDTIKGAFSRLHITIPKPKIPRISVSMKKGAMGIPYPDFNVHWNAKGAIFNGATLLGGGQGVGEAGAEAVIPIQHKRYMAPFARAVADNLPMKDNAEKPQDVTYTFSIPLYLDGREVARGTAKFTKEELEKLENRKSRMEGNI
ncbi:phage tail tape measure protein [Neobacillus rhizosphaerae]|uniref:phage tail tape measure protein n=1 Tax=Neobacillus rhizosphaerae TaxID=2880965 RepID=UPI003D2E2D74